MGWKTALKMSIIMTGCMFAANQAAAMHPLARRVIKNQTEAAPKPSTAELGPWWFI